MDPVVTPVQWNTIIGTPGSSFATNTRGAGRMGHPPAPGGSRGRLPDWTQSSLTGGPMEISRWFSNPYDGD